MSVNGRVLGKVKRFYKLNGYGFARVEHISEDVFIHIRGARGFDETSPKLDWRRRRETDHLGKYLKLEVGDVVRMSVVPTPKGLEGFPWGPQAEYDLLLSIPLIRLVVYKNGKTQTIWQSRFVTDPTLAQKVGQVRFEDTSFERWDDTSEQWHLCPSPLSLDSA
ncbi:MAG: hypothetical protein UX19_C0006G0012 [Candidatus Woesebacteria bacterium GW2011_GWA1_45_8]|uniref:Uncharacterized protein n=1 Tax=Candidatus Woesebacteria bacterium GW2011_GWA1_45_8 TaxID=1618559 RepID=A0A0G1MV23_9BACT|nr:MAG: hypothetical protein UX19_C0006G0012 [Candidatus Woesebacteria bacterium GW2011_GWA1_45_8]